MAITIYRLRWRKNKAFNREAREGHREEREEEPEDSNHKGRSVWRTTPAAWLE
jgi:hypothetical protein